MFTPINEIRFMSVGIEVYHAGRDPETGWQATCLYTACAYADHTMRTIEGTIVNVANALDTLAEAIALVKEHAEHIGVVFVDPGTLNPDGAINAVLRVWYDPNAESRPVLWRKQLQRVAQECGAEVID